VTFHSKQCISSLDTSLDSANNANKLSNKKGKVLNQQKISSFVDRLSQNQPKKFHKDVLGNKTSGSPSKVKRKTYSQSPTNQKPILMKTMNKNESQKTVKFQNTKDDNKKEGKYLETFMRNSSNQSHSSNQTNHTNQSNKSLRENLTDFSNVNYYSEIDDQLNEIRDIIDHNINKN
jgi:hypothetical protein